MKDLIKALENFNDYPLLIEHITDEWQIDGSEVYWEPFDTDTAGGVETEWNYGGWLIEGYSIIGEYVFCNVDIQTGVTMTLVFDKDKEKKV